MRRAVVLFPILVAATAAGQPDGPCPGFIAAEPQAGIVMPGSASLAVSLQPNPTAPNPLQVVELAFVQGETFTVEPGSVRLAAREKVIVHVAVRGENLGLVQLQGHTADGTHPCVILDTPVDLDFENAVRVQVDSANADVIRSVADLASHGSIDTGQARMVQLRLVTHGDSRPVSYDTPITGQVAASAALLSNDGTTWQPTVTASLQKGWSAPLYLKPTRYAGTGTLRVDLKADSSGVASLRTEAFRFSIHPPALVRVGLAVLGGVAYAIAALLADKRARKKTAGAAASAVSAGFLGALAGGLAEQGWLPLTIPKADIWGYVLTGFLFAATGIDGIVSRLKAFLQVKQGGS